MEERERGRRGRTITRKRLLMHGQSGQSRKRNTAMGMGPPKTPAKWLRIRRLPDQQPATDCIAGSGRCLHSPVRLHGANGPDRTKLIGVFRGAPSGGRRKRCVWTADCVCVREGTSDLARNRVISCLLWTGSTKIIPSNFYGHRKVNRTGLRSAAARRPGGRWIGV